MSDQYSVYFPVYTSVMGPLNEALRFPPVYSVNFRADTTAGSFKNLYSLLDVMNWKSGGRPKNSIEEAKIFKKELVASQLCKGKNTTDLNEELNKDLLTMTDLFKFLYEKGHATEDMVLKSARFKDEMAKELKLTTDNHQIEEQVIDKILQQDKMNKDALCKNGCKNKNDFKDLLEQTDEVRIPRKVYTDLIEIAEKYEGLVKYVNELEGDLQNLADRPKRKKSK